MVEEKIEDEIRKQLGAYTQCDVLDPSECPYAKLALVVDNAGISTDIVACRGCVSLISEGTKINNKDKLETVFIKNGKLCPTK